MISENGIPTTPVENIDPKITENNTAINQPKNQTKEDRLNLGVDNLGIDNKDMEE